ncbi:hypothetical protein D3C87_1780290 [compost metagenome]
MQLVQLKISHEINDPVQGFKLGDFIAADVDHQSSGRKVRLVADMQKRDVPAALLQNLFQCGSRIVGPFGRTVIYGDSTLIHMDFIALGRQHWTITKVVDGMDRWACAYRQG